MPRKNRSRKQLASIIFFCRQEGGQSTSKMNTTLTILLLAVLVSPAYVQHCERRQRIHLDSYQSTKVVFPQQFPVQKGYAGNLTCVWEILTESKFRIMVYPRTWTCGDMTVLNLFYGLSEMAEIDDCVICPSEKVFVQILYRRDHQTLFWNLSRILMTQKGVLISDLWQ